MVRLDVPNRARRERGPHTSSRETTAREMQGVSPYRSASSSGRLIRGRRIFMIGTCSVVIVFYLMSFVTRFGSFFATSAPPPPPARAAPTRDARAESSATRTVAREPVSAAPVESLEIPSKVMSVPTPKTNQLRVDVRFRRLRDPLFGLMESPVFRDDAALLSFLDRVEEIYEASGVTLRFNREEALTPEYLTPDQSRAYLFYVVGHSRVSINQRQTHILGGIKARQWILDHFEKLKGAGYLASIQTALDVFFRDFASASSAKYFVNATTTDPLVKLGLDASSAALVLEGLIGDAEERKVTPESFQWAWFEATRVSSLEYRIIHLAFRLFYLRAGLSVARAAEFIGVLEGRPMLFLHYAIGRDVSLTLNEPNRSKWEHDNVLSLYPVPYYHDMNGRGSTKWADVVFRTTSCFEPRVARVGGEAFPIQCRWGVRFWEKHVANTLQLARVAAHELGHCLGLEHPSPKCLLFEEPATALLMQQMRAFSLPAWGCEGGDKGNNCGCALTDAQRDELARVGVYIAPAERRVLLEHAAKRDVYETPFAEGVVRVGPALALTRREGGAARELGAEAWTTAGPTAPISGRVVGVRLARVENVHWCTPEQREIKLVFGVFGEGKASPSLTAETSLDCPRVWDDQGRPLPTARHLEARVALPVALGDRLALRLAAPSATKSKLRIDSDAVNYDVLV